MAWFNNVIRLVMQYKFYTVCSFIRIFVLRTLKWTMLENPT